MAVARLVLCLLLYLPSVNDVCHIRSTTYRKESADILDLMMMLQEDSESSSDSDEEESLELLFLDLAYQPKRDMTQILSVDSLNDLDFEFQFRQGTYSTSLRCFL